MDSIVTKIFPSAFSKMRPVCIGVDDILFRKPVHIGSLLYLSSQVVFFLQEKIDIWLVHTRNFV